MTTNSTSTDATNTSTDLAVDYDVAPIEIRDPVAEALGILEPGDPFIVTYADVVKEAGHSCPTASGAFRITQLGLAELYPDANEHPVRSDIEVTAGGPRDEPTYGVMSRIVSYITGAAEEGGFGGLANGYGDRKHHLHFGDADTVDPTFTFDRTDTDDTVQVTYHVGEVPDAGPATQYLGKLIDGTATNEEREAFAEAWHGRVRAVLTDDDLFTVTQVK